MVGTKLIGGWAAVALTVLAFASGAAGADSSLGGSAILEMRGTHGYSLFVMAGQRPGRAQGRVVVLAGKPHSHVSYAAPATVTPTSLEADLGAVGHISLQLQPSGVKQADRDCDGKRVEYEGANWVGDLDLRGEEGFTAVSTTRLPFSLKPVFRLICGVSSVGLQTNGDGAILHISTNGPAPRLNLSARTNGPGKAVEVAATVRERDGEVNISRTVERRFPSSVFDYAPDLTEATLKPPAPFSGRGVFRSTAAPANRWIGNLTVDFPGHADLPVTGTGFNPSMRHGEWRTEPTGEPR